MAVVVAALMMTCQIASALLIPSNNRSSLSPRKVFRTQTSKSDDAIKSSNKDNAAVSRQEAMRRMMNASLFLSGSVLFGQNKPSQAACLSGDTNEDCIGFYKVPIDDAILPYVGTKEQLLRYAPDVRWVPPMEYPESYADARKQLVTDLERCGALEDTLLNKADFTGVGKLMLEISPRVTVAGRVILDTLYTMEQTQSNNDHPSMTAYKVETAFDELVALFGQTDIALGQAIRGEFGVVTVAQLAILPSVKELVGQYTDFVKILPADDSIPKNIKSKRRAASAVKG